MNTDFATLLTCVGPKVLSSEGPIYLNQVEMDALDRLCADPGAHKAFEDLGMNLRKIKSLAVTAGIK